MRALQLLEDDTCSGCGQPATIAYDKDSRGHWLKSVSRCEACMVLEEGRKSSEPGLHVHVIPDEGLRYAIGNPIPPPEEVTVDE